MGDTGNVIGVIGAIAIVLLILGAAVHQYISGLALRSVLEATGFVRKPFKFKKPFHYVRELKTGLGEFSYESMDVGDTITTFNPTVGVSSSSTSRMMHCYEFWPNAPLNLALQVSTINFKPPPFEMKTAFNEPLKRLVRADFESLLMKGVEGRDPCALFLDDDRLKILVERDDDIQVIERTFAWMEEVYQFIGKHTSVDG